MSGKETAVNIGVCVADFCIGWMAGVLHWNYIDPHCDGKLSKLMAVTGTVLAGTVIAEQANRYIYKTSDELLDTDFMEYYEK